MPLLISTLTRKNFMVYAARHYNNPRILDIQEFYEDVARFKIVKRLLKRYIEKNILEERRILNEIITIHNVFLMKASTQMLFFQFDEEYFPALKTFLLYLNYITDEDYINVPVDLFIVKKLQQI